MTSTNDVNKTYDFELDLDNGYLGKETISLIQSSSGVRVFKIALTKENLPFTLTNCLVKVCHMKPDDSSVVNDVQVLSDNIIAVELTEQCMTEDGKIRCEIIVIDLIDKRFITFPPFKFKVKGSLFVNSEIESSTEFQTLINAIVKVDNINLIADEKFNRIDEQLAHANTTIGDINVVAGESLSLLASIESNHVNAQNSTQEIFNNLDISESILDEAALTKVKIDNTLLSILKDSETISSTNIQATSNLNLIIGNKLNSATQLAAIQNNKTTTDSLLGRIQSNDYEATKSLNAIKLKEKEAESILVKLRQMV